MPFGREDYSRYYYLWHLIAIGVLTVEEPDNDEACPKIEQVIWDQADFARDSAKIALIDMGIARHHPNLDAKTDDPSSAEHRVIWEDALDLASHRYGAKYTPLPTGDRHREQRIQHLLGIDETLPTSTSPAEDAILRDLKNGYGVERFVHAYDQRFATHGTACAGLVCGTTYNEDQFGNQGNPITYYGVDPYSRIVPITTSISPDPFQLIAAFLYAHSLEVDVILFPRDAADPDKMPHYGELDDSEKTRLHSSEEVTLAWGLLGKVIKAVSMDIPVVCAAGNDGRSELIYPASLAREAGNGIIAVGAVSYAAYRSGYSNYGNGLTVVAPSDDGEVYNRHQIRLDKQSPDITDFWVDDVHEHPDIPEIPFSAERLITLDVPGPRGYVSASRRGPTQDRAEAVDDPGGLYTEIGGTSGAAALVAGVVALMQRQSDTRLSGPVIKDNIIPALPQPNVEVSHWYWLEDGQDMLQIDAVNGPPDPDARALFGEGGLVNVPSLLGVA